MAVHVLQVVTSVLVLLAMTASVAHALELPGKMRLSKDAYFTVQRIYYRGFTMAGVSEPLGVVGAAILLVLTPRGGEFWYVLTALLGLVGMQVVYWLFTQPVNRVWLRGGDLGRAGAGFFAAGGRDAPASDWTALRNRWEWSPAARAYSDRERHRARARRRLTMTIRPFRVDVPDSVLDDLRDR